MNVLKINILSNQRVKGLDILLLIEKCFLLNGYQLNRESIEVLLKKLKSINNIVIENNDSFESLHNRQVIIELITKICLHLNAVNYFANKGSLKCPDL